MDRGTVFKRCLSSRCPQCGEGELFEAYSKLWESCAACELRYRREHGAMTGAMYLSAVITEVLAAALCVALFLFTDWSVPTGLMVGIPLVVAFAIMSYPKMIAPWVAVEYWTDLKNGEAWVKPR